MCSLRLDVHRVQRFACGHEQTIASRTAKAYVRAGFRQTNHPDPRAVRANHLYAGPSACPDVAVDVAADAVGGRRRAGSWDVELDEPLAVAQRFAVHVIHPDVP